MCSFRDEYETGEGRFVVTNTLQVGPSYVLQVELVMNCHQAGSSTASDAPVLLEFSTDYGITWSLVRSGCWPPRTCDEYHMPSVFYASEFSHWKRVTIVLPQSTWWAQLLLAIWMSSSGLNCIVLVTFLSLNRQC